MRITGSLALVFVVAFSAGVLHGCGGSSSQKATPKCVLSSECTGNLVCALGYCVQQCTSSKDCGNSELCVKLDNGNACRAPEAAKKCALNSDCMSPLVCGKDLSCRTECAADVDCPGGGTPKGTPGRQVCTASKTCADPAVDGAKYDPTTNDFVVPSTGAAGSTGAGGALAGTNGAAGSTGAAGDATGAAGSAAGSTGSAGAAAGSTGAAGSNPDAGTGAAGATVDAGNPEVAEAVDMTTVTPNKSVHQGAAVTITVTKTAGGLSNPMVVSFGALDKSKAVVQASSTDTSLVIKANVPHGAALGDQTLVVSTAGGTVTLTNVLTVTAITAGPAGSDANAGSAASPFRSVKQALVAADVGDTIHLMDGTYSSTPAAMGGSDETWNYPIPNNVIITGDSAAGTILDGAGAPNTDAFDSQAMLSLSNMTIKHFRYGVYVNQPSTMLTMAHFIISTCTSYAIYIDTAALNSTISLTGADSLIDQPSGYTAIQVNGNSSSTNEKIVINITDATVTGGYYGINLSYASGTTLNLTNATLKMAGTSYNTVIYTYQQNNVIGNSVVIKNSTITGTINMNDKNGVLNIMGGTLTQKTGNLMELGSGGSFTLNGTKLTMNDNNYAINFTAPNGTLNLTGVTINGGSAGVGQSGAGSTAKLRTTEILSPYYYAYYLSAGNLDLGTATDAGGDGLGLPVSTSYYSLYVSSATSTITSSSTTYGDHLDGTNALVQGKLPGMSVVVGPATSPPQYYTISSGSQISFFN